MGRCSSPSGHTSSSTNQPTWMSPIEHRPGKGEIMQLVDALSRRHDLRESKAAEACYGVLEDTAATYFTAAAYNGDTSFSNSDCLQRYEVHKEASSGYYFTWCQGRRLLVVPRNEALFLELFPEAHAASRDGHPAIWATLERLRQYFWWLHQQRDVRLYVRSCGTCQRVKIPRQRLGGPAQPLPIPTRNAERSNSAR